MKKCNWCHSNIEDNATICPFCKAEQSSVTNTQTNHVERFLEKHPDGKVTNERRDPYMQKMSNDFDNNYLSQIAGDVRVIKNIVIGTAILYVLGAIYIALNVIW